VKSYANERLKVAEMELPPLKNGAGEFEVQVMEPGIVRHVAYKLVERQLVSSANGGRPEFDAQLVMYFEVSPGAPLRNRRFCVLREGMSMVPVEGYDRVYLGTALIAQVPDPAHVYELRKVQS
jgi:hypothetical protein